MVVERVARHVGGGEDLDVEPLEQRPRPELKGAEPLCDRVVDRSGSLPRELLLDAEHVVELVVEPGAGRRATKQEIVLGERSEEHTSELQSPCNLVCRLLLEKKE